MRRGLSILAVVLVLLFLLLWRAPAWLISDRLGQVLPGAQPGPARGTFWHGQLDSFSYAGVTLGEVSWRISLLGLAKGAPLSIAVASPLTASAVIGPEGEGLKVADLTARGGVATLLSAAGLPTMGFDGHFALEVDSANIIRGRCDSLSGSLVVRDLQGDIDGIDAIGTVPVQLDCRGGNVLLTLDGNNPINVRGQLRVSPEGRPSGQLQLSPPPSSPLFDNLTLLLGRPRNGKDFSLRL